MRRTLLPLLALSTRVAEILARYLNHRSLSSLEWRLEEAKKISRAGPELETSIRDLRAVEICTIIGAPGATMSGRKFNNTQKKKRKRKEKAGTALLLARSSFRSIENIILVVYAPRLGARARLFILTSR